MRLTPAKYLLGDLQTVGWGHKTDIEAMMILANHAVLKVNADVQAGLHRYLANPSINIKLQSQHMYLLNTVDRTQRDGNWYFTYKSKHTKLNPKYLKKRTLKFYQILNLP